MNGPEAPENIASDTLRFERAVHDAAVFERDRVQRARDVQMADLLEVGRIVAVVDALVAVIHDEQLQCDRWITFGRTEAIAIAGEGQPPAGQRARAGVE